MSERQLTRRFSLAVGESPGQYLQKLRCRYAQDLLQNTDLAISDIGDLRRAEKSLARMAFIDSLTGVGNRVHLERSLVNALSSISDEKRIAVLYIDLDGFKAVNDTLGHAEGDRLLQAVAERFTQCVRENDVVTRVGGDGFVIVVTEVNDESGLIVMADKLLKSVSEPFVLASEVVEVSASIGISITTDLINTHETLLTSADTALFHAKRHGKNCYQHILRLNMNHVCWKTRCIIVKTNNTNNQFSPSSFGVRPTGGLGRSNSVGLGMPPPMIDTMMMNSNNNNNQHSSNNNNYNNTRKSPPSRSSCSTSFGRRSMMRSNML